MAVPVDEVDKALLPMRTGFSQRLLNVENDVIGEGVCCLGYDTFGELVNLVALPRHETVNSDRTEKSAYRIRVPQDAAPFHHPEGSSLRQISGFIGVGTPPPKGAHRSSETGIREGSKDIPVHTDWAPFV
jgi:hypothetical protein